jgi:stringent starvation protein B
MNPDERPSKREAFMAFLRDGWVSLHLDARRPGVIVPTMFAAEPHLVLQYGRNMPIPIPDLDVSESGVTATLSFSRTPHTTHVPWSAIYVVACTDGRGILYYEDVPQEVSLSTSNQKPPGQPRQPGQLEQVELAGQAQPQAQGDDDEDDAEAEDEDPSASPAPLAPMRRLRSVPADSGAVMEEPADLEAPKRRRRPQLRLVK